MGKLLFALVASFVLSILLLMAGPHVAPGLTERIYCPAGTRMVTGSHTAYDPVARTDVKSVSTDCLDSNGARVNLGFYRTVVAPFLVWLIPVFLSLWLLGWLAGRATAAGGAESTLENSGAESET